MTVKFLKDQRLSYDGLNVKDYKAGETYTATHAHEGRTFAHLLESGICAAPDAVPSDVETVEEPKSKIKPKVAPRSIPKISPPSSKK